MKTARVVIDEVRARGRTLDPAASWIPRAAFFFFFFYEVDVGTSGVINLVCYTR